ncbi:MAG: 2-oxoacid:acceptor oxidoreductase family protein [Nanoarchaeota archaeon]|nr:2-oxoacid:acceptor oxidoreductase family protein [Nanoarchaeota archaeon]MBU1004304.1 2-oxoacid:acceptor oxidoreductase family protein [Nanoarchaeota archaeon]MBU1945478.1 2-oxoacid:acceptor oxidoreductase family protein [Nanoarchaeota archaeon]
MEKGLLEIRIHGRGGQGAKTASQFIAESALGEGKHIQSFPEYGPERAGAPMKAYARISDKAISNYAPVISPDVVMVIDPTLMVSIDVTEGMSDKGILIVNTPKSADDIRKELKNYKGKLYTVDATKISIDTVGKNLPNTPMLGAFVKLTNAIPLDAVKKSCKDKFLKKLGEEKTNATINGIDMAYEAVK